MTHFNMPHGDVEEDFNKLPLLRFLVMHGVLFLAELKQASLPEYLTCNLQGRIFFISPPIDPELYQVLNACPMMGEVDILISPPTFPP